MADIPSDIASSAAQAGFQAREVSKEREARSAGRANATERVVKAVDEAGTTVDTDDADMAVFTDAEGTGGQGRPFEEEESGQEETNESSADDGGIHRDEDGHLHLDLEA